MHHPLLCGCGEAALVIRRASARQLVAVAAEVCLIGCLRRVTSSLLSLVRNGCLVAGLRLLRGGRIELLPPRSRPLHADHDRCQVGNLRIDGDRASWRRQALHGRLVLCAIGSLHLEHVHLRAAARCMLLLLRSDMHKALDGCQIVTRSHTVTSPVDLVLIFCMTDIRKI